MRHLSLQLSRLVVGLVNVIKDDHCDADERSVATAAPQWYAAGKSRKK